MAELRESDKRAILGENYREPAVTPESRAADAAARRLTMRNMAIGIGLLVLLIVLAAFFGRGR